MRFVTKNKIKQINNKKNIKRHKYFSNLITSIFKLTIKLCASGDGSKKKKKKILGMQQISGKHTVSGQSDENAG